MHPEPDSLRSSLLVASLGNLDVPHFLAPVISAAARASRDRLLIVLVSPLFNAFPQGISHTEKWNEVQCILTFVYVQATKVAQDMDKVLMEVDVLLRGTDEGISEKWAEDMDRVYYVQGDKLLVAIPAPIASLQAVYVDPAVHPAEPSPPHPRSPQPPSTTPLPSKVRAVALGGTFDHLHAGHKILLSMGAWICARLVVGLSSAALLAGKAYAGVLEPYEQREARVHAFVALFAPCVARVVVPIVDLYGPTGWDPEIEALVVSKETLGGARAIAVRRAEKSLPPLHTFVIDVISPEHTALGDEDLEMLKATKMSSTFIREWVAKRQAAAGQNRGDQDPVTA